MTHELLLQSLAIALYFGVLILVATISYKKQHSAADFIMGNRSMNFWLTALAAHASDMSSWLFMGYPATIFTLGIHQSWAGIGLWIFMLLNWQLIAPRIRTATEAYNSLTFSAFFESRLGDRSGLIRIFTAIMLFLFYTIYISAALVGMGLVLNTLFGIPYQLGVILGVLIVIPYVFIGGYLTLAWIDLFQGIFLLLVICIVPLYILPSVGGFSGIASAVSSKGISTSLFPNFSGSSLAEILFLTVGWGLGYFGQPHIITKFMGIRKVGDIWKSKLIGMTWMLLALSAATLVGAVGIAFFQTKGLVVDSEVFIQMVKQTFPPFLVGFVLCAVLAATINAMSSMVLVLSSSLTEDFYKRLFRIHASPKELLWVSRFSVAFVSAVAFIIALGKISTIYGLVLYAWSGLGSAFGPLLLLCLYMKRVSKQAAWAGIISGGTISAIWPLFAPLFPIDIPPLPPAFLVSILSIYLISKWMDRKELFNGKA